jgi:hypothetical protein
MKKILDLSLGLLMLLGLGSAVMGAIFLVINVFFSPDAVTANYLLFTAGMVAGGAILAGVCYWLSNRYFPAEPYPPLKLIVIIYYIPAIIAVGIIWLDKPHHYFWTATGISLVIVWMVAFQFIVRAMRRSAKGRALLELALADLLHRRRHSSELPGRDGGE